MPIDENGLANYASQGSGQSPTAMIEQNTLAASGVSPEQAAAAIQAAPAIGASPSALMRSPDTIAQAQDISQSNTDRAIRQASPALSAFHAGSPVNVALTGTDSGKLAGIADSVNQWFADQSKFDQQQNSLIAQPTVDAYKAFQNWTKTYDKAAMSGDFVGAAKARFGELGSTAGVLLGPLSGIANSVIDPLAGFIAKYGPQAYGGGTFSSPPKPLDYQGTKAQVKGSLGLALLGLAPELPGTSLVSGEAGAEAGTAAIAPAPHPIVGNWTADEAGNILHPTGEPVIFDNPKSAAQWIIQANKITPEGVSLNLVNGAEEGTFGVQAFGGPKAPPGVNPLDDAVHAEQADVASQGIKNLQTQIADTNLHDLAPDKMEEFLEHTDVAGETVHVDPNALIKLAQENQFPFPERAQQIILASQLGHEVQIPIEEYLSKTSGQSFADELNAGTRFSETGVSQNEGKELSSNETQALVPETTPEEPSENLGPSPSVPRPEVLPADNADKTTFNQELATLPPDIKAEELGAVPARAEGAVDKVFKEQFLKNIFQTPAAAGMTKTEFGRYSTRVEEAKASLKEKLLQRTYDQIRRERTPKWKSQVEQQREILEPQIAGRKDLAARTALEYGVGPRGEPLLPIKLSRERTSFGYGQDTVDNLPKGMFRSGSDEAKGLYHPDQAAELLGYNNGEELLRDLLKLEEERKAGGFETSKAHTKGLVTEAATNAARNELGYDVSPEGLEAAAKEAVVSPEIEDYLSEELKALAKKVGLNFDKATVKTEALDLFSQIPFEDALELKVFEAAMLKTGNLAEQFLLRNNPIEAFRAKQKQLMNHYMLPEAHKRISQNRVLQKQIKSLAQKPAVKGMDSEFRNQLRHYVKQLGYNVKNGKYGTPAQAVKGETIDKFVDRWNESGYSLFYVDPIPWNQMKVGDFDAAREFINSFSEIGRDLKRVYTAGEAAKLTDIVNQIVENADKIGRPFPAGELRQLKNSFRGAMRTAGGTLGSAVTRPETSLFWLDGETVGPLMKYLVGETQTGKYYKADALQEMNKDFQAFTKSQPEGWGKSLSQKVNIPELTYSINAKGEPVPWIQTKMDAIMASTYLGEVSSMKKLTEGFGWNEGAVRNALNRTLTKADWDYMDFIHRQYDKLWPKVQELYRIETGLPLKEEQFLPIQTPHGTYAGGHRHITYDWNVMGEHTDEDGNTVTVNDPTAIKNSELFGPDYRKATPPNSYTLARTGFSAPVNLEHSTLAAELEQVIHDLAYRKALIQANKILSQPRVQIAFREALGPEYLVATKNWIKDVAREAGYDQAQLKGLAGLVRGFRRRFTLVQIGYNVATLVKHGSIAASHLNGEVGAGNFFRAQSELNQTGEAGQRVKEFVDSNSGEVRNALVNLDRDVGELIRDEYRKQGYISAIRYHAFTMFGMVKQMEARATWLAKYRTLTDVEDKSHEDAVALANKAVRDTQGAGSVVDLPTLWRGGTDFWAEVGKLLNVFTGFENTATNRQWTMIRRNPRMVKGFKDNGWAGGKRDFNSQLNDLQSYIMVPAILSAVFSAIIGASWTSGSEDKKQKSFADILAENLIKSELGGSIPGGNILASIPDMIRTNGKSSPSDPVEESMVNLVHTLIDVKRFASGEGAKVEDRWVQRAVENFGLITKLPTKPFAKAGQYLWDQYQGHVENSNPGEELRGLLTGPTTSQARKHR